MKVSLTKQIAAACMLLLFVCGASAQAKKEFKYNAAPGTALSVSNEHGSVTVKVGTGRQVLISATPASNAVEVDASQAGNRINVRSHKLQNGSGDARVDYDITVPADCAVSVDAEEGLVRIDGLKSNVHIDSEAAAVEVKNISGGSVRVQAVSGAVTLADVKQSMVEIVSTGGNIQLSNVSGGRVSAKSTTGKISFTGDFAGGGNYTFTNHSGDIEVGVPSAASVDLTARSLKGSVESDLTLQKPEHTAMNIAEGKSIAGRLNTGASSVDVRSFSGKIRVKKQ
jgi:DUF4097 and DUF4098 domain-containing protein YvlB